MTSDFIRPFQVILILMTAVGLKNHVTIIPPLLKYVGRDGWASVLASSLLLVPWALLLVYVHKKTNQQDMNIWLRERLGKVFSNIFNYVLGFLLILLAAFTMRETLTWMSSTFLPETPPFPLLIVYTVLCIMLASTNLRTIAIANAFVLVLVIAFGFFVSFANIPVKDYTLLRPFFENGYQPVLKGLVYPASGIVELVMLFFIQHQIKGRMRFIHYLIIIGILTVLTIGPLVGAIIEFGPDEATKQRFPAYEEWGLVTVGQFIEHVDFLSIYQWLTGTFIRVGLIFYIVVNVLGWNGQVKKITGFIAPLFLGICTWLLIIEDSTFIKLKGDYVLPITFGLFFIISILFVIVAMVTRKSARRKET